MDLDFSKNISLFLSSIFVYYWKISVLLTHPLLQGAKANLVSPQTAASHSKQHFITVRAAFILKIAPFTVFQ